MADDTTREAAMRAFIEAGIRLRSFLRTRAAVEQHTRQLVSAIVDEVGAPPPPVACYFGAVVPGIVHVETPQHSSGQPGARFLGRLGDADLYHAPDLGFVMDYGGRLTNALDDDERAEAERRFARRTAQ